LLLDSFKDLFVFVADINDDEDDDTDMGGVNGNGWSNLGGGGTEHDKIFRGDDVGVGGGLRGAFATGGIEHVRIFFCGVDDAAATAAAAAGAPTTALFPG